MTPLEQGDAAPNAKSRWVYLIPLVLFLALCVLFFVRLNAGDASRIPSALIGKSAPVFVLPALEGSGVGGLGEGSLFTGEPTLVNIFASWCAPCHQEHPALMALKARGVRIVGVLYKDDPANGLKFLKEGGNPFAAIGVDRAGRATIDLGVYGVPETFLVRGDGVIAKKFIGELKVEDVEKAFADLNPR